MTNLAILEIPREPLQFVVSPFDNHKLQYTLQVCRSFLVLFVNLSTYRKNSNTIRMILTKSRGSVEGLRMGAYCIRIFTVIIYYWIVHEVQDVTEIQNGEKNKIKSNTYMQDHGSGAVCHAISPQLQHCRGCSMPPLVWLWTHDPTTTYHNPSGNWTGYRSTRG